MQRLFLILLLFLSANPVGAQTLNPSDYIYPMRGVQGLHSANFGEMRPNHFHSGVDIKTDGVEGKPLVAVANGYVSRISVSPSGYGRALYIQLNNGTTAVYGHLSRFSDDLEQYLYAERMRQHRNRLDLRFEAGKFPVKQGDLVAFSGNSGSSYGPHLHFELRESATQRPMNLVQQGVIRPKDDISPYILRIHYIETDTVRGVPLHRKPTSYEAAKIDKKTFRLSRRDPVEIGMNGYFVVEATDRRNGVSNTFGLYRTTLYIDGTSHFEYRMDGFTFDRSRDCNAASYYPLQLTSRNECIRLAAIDGACPTFWTIQENRGVVSAAAGEVRVIRIEAEDDCGNCSHIEFKVRGRTPWKAEEIFEAEVCDRSRPTVLTTPGARLAIPAEALYESLLLRIEPSNITPASDTLLPILSPAYRLIDRTTPLRKAVVVTINAKVPEALHPYAVLGLLTPDGRISYVGGRYSENSVTARTMTTGDMLIVADTIAPIVKPLFTPGSNLSNMEKITFHISDNFSGITSCDLYIDGAWVICDRYPIKGTAIHIFDTPCNGKQHTLRLVIRDACGNRTDWQGSFIR